jgi:hypothetical protein
MISSDGHGFVTWFLWFRSRMVFGFDSSASRFSFSVFTILPSVFGFGFDSPRSSAVSRVSVFGSQHSSHGFRFRFGTQSSA